MKSTKTNKVQSNSSSALKSALNGHVVSVVVAATGDFHTYKSGVYNGSCTTSCNHAVTAVGYGTDSKGGDYYIIRNSWGGSWGESGYMKLKITDGAGKCGVQTNSDYPTTN